MSDIISYGTSPIKRVRSTSAQMEERYAALLEIVATQKPMTVRQVFYQATVLGVVEKTEHGYDKVCNGLVHLRRTGRMPYHWLADNTRWMRRPTTFSGIEEAVYHTARTYRKSLWDDADAYVEVWLEKDALAGVVVDITDEYDVPLMVARGYSSLSFLHSAAESMAEENCTCFIYHFGDYDPSGVNAAEKIEETLRDLAPDADIEFTRAAVTEQQIRALSLPSRPTKTTDSRFKTWTGGDSVELDAIPPATLRALVRSYIEDHIDADRLRKLKVAEASEREALAAFARRAVR